MNKIKQILCIALTFAVLGGCTQIKKADAPPEETSLTENLTAISEMQETEQITNEMQTETTKTETERLTAAQTTAVVSTEASTTAKPLTTVGETSAPATTQPATTETVPTQSEDGIIIGLKRMLFGSSSQEITAVFGNPAETVTEKLTSGGTVTSLVYADNYREFAVFQLLNGRFFGFYTCVRDTIVTDGEKAYSLRTGGETQIGSVKITEFTDKLGNGKAYAFRAGYNGFEYLPVELESLDGQERLIFHATNAIRALNGVAALEYSEKAADCVRNHCRDMSERNYFSHDTPEGVTSAQRLRGCGIAYSKCGENLAAGYQDAFGIADGWYNSSGHRKNMLDSGFDYVGIGVAQGNGDYHIYAGQNYYR